MRIVLIADDATELAAVDVLYRLAESEHEIALVVDHRNAPAAPVAVRRRARWERLNAERVIEEAPHAGIVAELHVRGIESRTLAHACDALGLSRRRSRDFLDDGLLLEIEARGPDVILALFQDPALQRLAPLAPEGLLSVSAGAGGAPGGACAAAWAVLMGKPPAVLVIHRPSWADGDESDGEGDGDGYGDGVGYGYGASSASHSIFFSGPMDLRRLENRLELELVTVACNAVDQVARGAGIGDQPVDAATESVGVMAEPLREVVEVWLGSGRAAQGAMDGEMMENGR